jgi:Ca2+-binding EF-hand superfamily protein
MGIQAETLLDHAEGWRPFIAASEHLFTALFAVELGLRLHVLGWQSFMPCHGNMSNFVDAVNVLVSGVFIVWVMPLVGIPQSNALRTLTLLRACRLARLVRVVERVPAFQEIWQLMRGFQESMSTLFWTLVFIFVVTYVFAVFGVVLISTEVKELLREEVLESNREELTELLSVSDGIFSMMHTLIQVLTLDSWNGIARPLMKHIWWSIFYFYAYISVGAVVLLNLVTASIVDNAMRNSRKDQEQLLLEKQQKQKHLQEEFKTLFQMVDGDGDGSLTWTEFQDAFEVPEISTKLKMLDFEPSSCRELFSLLDTGDGALTLGEFFEGIQGMEGPAMAKDSFKLMKLVERMNRSLQVLADSLPKEAVTCCDDVLQGQCSQNQYETSAMQNPIATKVCQDRPVTPPPLLLPRSPVNSYSTGPPSSPAFTVSRRKLLRPCFDEAADSTTTMDSTGSRIDNIADQVDACNGKVDGLAATVSEIQMSLAVVIQHLNCKQALESGN